MVVVVGIVVVVVVGIVVVVVEVVMRGELLPALVTKS